MLLDPMGAQARVFVTRQLPGEALDRLVAEHDVEIWPERLPPPRSELMARAPELEGLLSLLTDPVDAELIDAAPKLRAISNYAVGVDNVDVEAATARGIPVGNTPGRAHRVDRGSGGRADARHRRGGSSEGEAFVRAGEWRTWEPELMLGRDLHGATVGIVGYGRIGQAVGRRLEGFGCELLHSQPLRLTSEELLERSDFVTIHCPLTPATRGLIDEAALAPDEADRLSREHRPRSDRGHGRARASATRGRARRRRARRDGSRAATRRSPAARRARTSWWCRTWARPRIATRERMADMAVDNLLAGLAGEPMPQPGHSPSTLITSRLGRPPSNSQ